MRKLLSAIWLLVLVATAAPASAGGALLDFDREFYVPGDVVHASSSVWLKSARGRMEDGPYFAYLSRFSGVESMPSPLPPDALRVAPAEVVPRPTGEHGDVAVQFVLPDLEPGQYWLTICNDPCKVQLGDIMPSLMTVASDDVEGRMMTRVEELSERLRMLRYELSNRVFGRRGDSLRNRLVAVERDVARLEAYVDELRAEARSAEQPPPEDESSAVSPLLAFVLPAALAGILLARRSRAT